MLSFTLLIGILVLLVVCVILYFLVNIWKTISDYFIYIYDELEKQKKFRIANDKRIKFFSRDIEQIAEDTNKLRKLMLPEEHIDSEK